jgi:NADH-quinone oxidoreductase subunit M
VKEYYIFLLVLQTGMIGAFVSLDFLLFFLFWEVMLVPMYFLIGIWGSDRRLYSAIKFFLYTLVGSVVMLLGILALYFHTHAIPGNVHVRHHAFQQMAIPFEPAVVDLPGVLPRVRHQGADVPVPHVAARRAHRRADGRLGHPGGRPPEDGHLRVHPLQPADPARGDARVRADDGRRSRSSASSTARSCALAQTDWKRLVAYSSVSHMAMVMLGMFALTPVGITGSIVQQINHGISTGALFLIVGIVYERRHTREISEYGGLSKVMPVYAASSWS